MTYNNNEFPTLDKEINKRDLVEETKFPDDIIYVPPKAGKKHYPAYPKIKGLRIVTDPFLCIKQQETGLSLTNINEGIKWLIDFSIHAHGINRRSITLAFKHNRCSGEPPLIQIQHK